MKLIFIRHASLISPYNNYELLDYNLLAGLSRREINPGIDRIANQEKAKIIQKEVDLVDTIILTSEAIRAQESAKLIFGENVHYTVREELNEIPFDLEKLCSPEEFRLNGMKSVRKEFFESIVNGSSLETLSSIQERISDLEKYLRNLNKKNVVIVTHGWFMRFLYAQFTLQRNIEKISIEEYLSYPVFGHLEKFTAVL